MKINNKCLMMKKKKVLERHDIDVSKLLKNDANEVAELIIEACEEQDEQESFILDKCFSKIQIANKKHS